MVKFIILLAVVATLAFLPVITFDSTVLPKMADLQSTYQNADASAQQILK